MARRPTTRSGARMARDAGTTPPFRWLGLAWAALALVCLVLPTPALARPLTEAERAGVGSLDRLLEVAYSKSCDEAARNEWGCSGWVYTVTRDAEISNYSGSARMYYEAWCSSSDRSELQPGMVIAVGNTGGSPAGRRYGHIGIYVGNDTVRQYSPSLGGINEISVDAWIARYGRHDTPRWGWVGGVRLVGGTALTGGGTSNPVELADKSLRGSLSGLVVGALESALAMLASSRLLGGNRVSATQGFDDVLSGTALPGLARMVSNTVIEPVAMALVGLWALVGLLGVARGAAEGERGPTLVEVFPIMATFALSTWLVTHSVQIIESLVGLSSAVAAELPSAATAALDASPSASSSVGRLLVELIAASIAWLSALVASLATSIALWARALELYVYAALAPLPIALVQHDRTRSAALRFLRGAAGLALSLAFTRLVLAAFPTIVASARGAISPGGGVLATSLAVVAASVTVTVGVRSAGSWGFHVMGD